MGTPKWCADEACLGMNGCCAQRLGRKGVAARADCKGLILLRRLAAGNGAKTAKEVLSRFLRGAEYHEYDVAV